MNRIEQKLQKLKAHTERPIDNQFQCTLLHAEIIKLENCLRMWQSFQKVPLAPQANPDNETPRTFKSWNGFKRETRIDDIHRWFADAFRIDVRRDLIEQVE